MRSNNKAIEAAKAVNDVIDAIITASSMGTIKDKCFIGVIGYNSDNIAPIVGGPLSHMDENPLKKVTVNGLEMPVWVEPKASGTTPMATAVEQACSMVEQWIEDHPHCFPPIVINITDGEPDDFDEKTGNAPETRQQVERLMALRTSDGNALFFNAKISGTELVDKVEYPVSESELADGYAKFLFNISSVIHSSLILLAREDGLKVRQGARAMVFNADEKTLSKFLQFGSINAQT
jgi:hypothetical protein